MRGLVLVLALPSALVGCSPDTPAPIEPEVAGISGSADGIDHWFAAADGSPGGNGTLEHPWTLDSALAGGRKVAGLRPVGAADTVWIRGGRYTGRFNATWGGLPGEPVVFIEYPGEQVVLDGNNGQGASASVLAVQLPWVEFNGFEITHSNPSRGGGLPNLVSNYGSHVRFINLDLHDGGVGLYNEHDNTDVEITGCVIYNNGWFAGGEGHGHGLYLKSDAGPVTAAGNVVFNQFAFGIHAFSDRNSTGIDSVVLLGNVVFNNSAVHTGRASANILVGGVPQFGAATRGVVSGNVAYYAPAVNASNVKIGYDTTHNGRIAVTGNVFAGGTVVLDVRNWDAMVVENDTLIGNPGDTSRVVALADPDLAAFQWAGNRFWEVAATSPRWRYRGTSYPLATWYDRTGFTADSLVAGAPPERIGVQPMGPGRAAIVVLHSAAARVAVILPPGTLAPGDSFQIRNVQRLSAGPVMAGRYDGSPLDVPLAAVVPDRPRNWNSAGPGTGSALHVMLLEAIR